MHADIEAYRVNMDSTRGIVGASCELERRNLQERTWS